MKEKGILPVSEAAARLQVSPVRIRAMIRGGIVEAEKIGDRWFVDKSSLERRKALKAPVGRPLAPLNAWGVLFLASRDFSQAAPSYFQSISPWMRSRIRSRIRKEGLRWLVPRLYKRAAIERFRAHPSDLSNLLEESGVVRAGISVASQYSMDVSDSGVVELYVHEKQLPRLRRKYLLEPSVRPNVILHVVKGPWPFTKSAKFVPIAVAALDMLESDDPRSRRAGEAMLDRVEAIREAIQEDDSAPPVRRKSNSLLARGS